MILARTKWGPQLYETAFGLLSERVADGFYYDNWDDGNPAHQWEDRARSIVDLPMPKCIGPQAEAARQRREDAAWAFLRQRSDHEYEGVEEVSVGP